MTRFHLLILLLLVSCATRQSEPILFDSNLVRSYAFELEDLSPFADGPYYAEYKMGKKRLGFVAVEHISSVKYPDLFQHPTLRTIESVFASLKPGMSIVEGIPTANELNPPSMLPKADTCRERRYQGDCGESFFVINQARGTKTSFVSGEPSEAEILKTVLAHGYRAEDLVGFYLLRKIPQWKRQKNLKHSDIKALVTPQLERYRQRVDSKLRFGIKDFEAWYKAKMPTPAKYMDFENNDPAPHGGTGATFVQKISNRVTFARDQSLLKRIEGALATHDRVLVVYGGSHWINLEPALAQALGKPEIRKLY